MNLKEVIAATRTRSLTSVEPIRPVEFELAKEKGNSGLMNSSDLVFSLNNNLMLGHKTTIPEDLNESIDEFDSN